MNYESHRWVSLYACMVASMCAGFAYAWSVFQTPLISLFNWSVTDVSLSFTVIMSTAAITAIFAGKALDYLQPRQIILIGGILFGIGISGIGYIYSLHQLYMCAVIAGIGLGTVYPGGMMSNIIRFFPDRPGYVSGLLTAGYGLGAVVWAPVAVSLVDQFGVLSTLKILGILFFVIISIFSRIVKTAPDGYRPKGWISTEITVESVGVEKTWNKMIADPLFYLIAGTLTLGEITGMMVIGHASPIAQALLKITPQAAAAIVGFLAISNTGGRLFWGWVSDEIGRYPVVILLLILGGAAMTSLTMVASYYVFVIVIGILGCCFGGFLALMAPLTAELFGTKNLGVNFGIMFLTVAIAAYVGPLLAAVVKQANHGDYTQAFGISALINLVGLILFVVFIFYRKRRIISQQKTV